MTDTTPRLLPVERLGPDVLLVEAEHQDVAGRKGWRTLGPGVTATPSGLP